MVTPPNPPVFTTDHLGNRFKAVTNPYAPVRPMEDVEEYSLVEADPDSTFPVSIGCSTCNQTGASSGEVVHVPLSVMIDAVKNDVPFMANVNLAVADQRIKAAKPPSVEVVHVPRNFTQTLLQQVTQKAVDQRFLPFNPFVASADHQRGSVAYQKYTGQTEPQGLIIDTPPAANPEQVKKADPQPAAEAELDASADAPSLNQIDLSGAKIADILETVGDSAELAQGALEIEEASGNPRVRLVKKLKEIIG